MNRVTLNGQDVTAAIRTPEMSDGASRVSALPEVRAALLGLQRRIGAAGGVVVEGRDIGTVVFPGRGGEVLSHRERGRARAPAGRRAGGGGKARRCRADEGGDPRARRA